MNAHPTSAEPRGQVAWELVDLKTEQVRPGQRELRAADFEVMVTPPPVTPQLGMLRTRPRQVAADAAMWLISGGRGVSTRRCRLVDDVWLILREQRAPSQPSVVALSAEHEQAHLSGFETFRVYPGGTTATQATGTGSLQLRWDRDRDGFHELVSTTAVTDITLRLRTARGPHRREPISLVRILAGSSVQWPRSVDGVRLVPRLRPDFRRPSEGPSG